MSQKIYHDWKSFLDNHKYIKDVNTCTHARIGSEKYGVYGGSYSIPNQDLDNFYDLYVERVFGDNPQLEYFTELQDRKNGGPILIDFDFRHEKNKRR